MCKIYSNYYGQMTTASTLKEAIEKADALKTKATQGEIFDVYHDGEKVYTTKG